MSRTTQSAKAKSTSELTGTGRRQAYGRTSRASTVALTSDVLRESGDGSVADRLGTWIAHNAVAVERYTQVLADVKAGGAPDLATLSVAVREIRNLIEAQGRSWARGQESGRATLRARQRLVGPRSKKLTTARGRHPHDAARG
jgi:glutamate dehydrogenase-like protein